jgi:hypothetical protein
VIAEEAALRRTTWATMPSYPGELNVYLTPDEEGRTRLNVFGVVGETLTFRIRYSSESPTFLEDDDTSELTERYPLLVKAELFSIAFSEINDFAMAATWAGLAVTRLREAECDDLIRRRSGRPLRMGG